MKRITLTLTDDQLRELTLFVDGCVMDTFDYKDKNSVDRANYAWWRRLQKILRQASV